MSAHDQDIQHCEQGITLQQPGALERREPSVGELIQQVIQKGDPSAVSMLERLVDLKLKVDENEARKAFARDLNLLQGEIQPIVKDAEIRVKGVLRSKFVKRGSLQRTIQPLLAKFGFSLSFGEEEIVGAEKKYSAKLLHRDGHFEMKYKTLPLDKSDFRSVVQSEGSTVSYAERCLIKMHLNIVEFDDKDDDGNGGTAFEGLTKDQILDIETGIADAKADRVAFLNWVSEVAGVGVTDLKQVAGKHYRTIMTAIEEKKRRSAK